jgi:hypothetical protein
MANSRATDGEDRVRRRRKSYSELEGKEKVTPEPEVSEVRRIRIERLEGNTTTRRSVATPKMTSESHATLSSLKSGSSHRRKSVHHRHSGKEETKHRRRTKSTSKDKSSYVYRSAVDRSCSSRTSVSEARRLGRDGESSDSEADSTQSEPIQVKPRRRKIKIVYVDEEDYKSSNPKERRSRTDREGKSHDRDIDESVRRSRAHSRRHSVVDAPPISSHRRYGFHSRSLSISNLLSTEAHRHEICRQIPNLPSRGVILQPHIPHHSNLLPHLLLVSHIPPSDQVFSEASSGPLYNNSHAVNQRDCMCHSRTLVILETDQ